jgi:hypothetical protein
MLSLRVVLGGRPHCHLEQRALFVGDVAARFVRGWNLPRIEGSDRKVVLRVCVRRERDECFFVQVLRTPPQQPSPRMRQSSHVRWNYTSRHQQEVVFFSAAHVGAW